MHLCRFLSEPTSSNAEKTATNLPLKSCQACLDAFFDMPLFLVTFKMKNIFVLEVHTKQAIPFVRRVNVAQVG